MHCHKCGVKLLDTAVYCHSCGEPVADAYRTIFSPAPQPKTSYKYLAVIGGIIGAILVAVTFGAADYYYQSKDTKQEQAAIRIR